MLAHALVGALSLFAVGQDQPSRALAPGHWPQWRGPNRDGVSTEDRLLHEWPKSGPPLLWKVREIGEGVGCVSVAGGLIFVQGYQGEKDIVSALDGQGKIAWSAPIGPSGGEKTFMRYVTQRSPTVDDALVFVTTWQGILCCLESTTGRILWRKAFGEDLGGRWGGWGPSGNPLVEGKAILCGPGGGKGSLAALDKTTGSVLWRSSGLKEVLNAAIVLTEIGGVRQAVAFTYESVAGVAVEDGRLLWRADCRGKTAVVSTPVVHDGFVFVSAGFGVGGHAFQVTAVDGIFKVEPLYESKAMEVQNGGIVRVRDHLYATNNRSLLCLELKSGKVVWEDQSVGKGCVVAGDGMLIVRGEKGAVALVEATPEGYRERGRFQQPDRTKEYPHTHPVIAGGRLYIRDQDLLLCYDVGRYDYRAPDPVWDLASKVGRAVVSDKAALPPAGGKPPDAAFVPTPQDVVEKMLELAKVTKDDVVYDLGSGDGRIVITASKSYGCRSVGFEINRGLVLESRLRAKEAKLDDLVTIEEKNLFNVDVTSATVLTLYLGASNNAKLLPQLRKLKPGARIVSHAHLLGEGGPNPEQELKLRSKEDHEEHTIYLWTAPLK